MKILIVYLLFAIAPLMSQNVGINATGSTPHSSSGLDVDFTDRGVLIPRLSDAQRNSIVNPAAGLLIYNTTTQCMNMFNGSGWRQSCFECTFQVVPGSVPATCEGDTLHLSTNSILGASYLWIGPNGFSSSNQNPKIPSVGLVASGVYSVTATLAGCTSSPQNVSATIIAKPNQPNASSNSPVIPGNTLQLFSSNVIGATYSWTGPNGFTSTQQNPIVSNFQAANQGIYKVVAIANGCASDTGTATATLPPYQVFTSNGTFSVPTGVNSIRVCVVGGGGGGGGGHSGGGGSGHVLTGTYAVVPGQNFSISIGSGGSGGAGGNQVQGTGGNNGTASSITGLLTANGGNGAGASTTGGNGGSGGGGGCNAGNPGPNGGSNGSPGGACTYSGGLGGNFNSLAIFSSGLSITAGAGGAGGTLSHSGGGGGGGVQITGYNVNGFDGVNNASAKGGRGFGGGGGGGGYNGSNGIYYQAGNGAPGLVYIEW